MIANTMSSITCIIRSDSIKSFAYKFNTQTRMLDKYVHRLVQYSCTHSFKTWCFVERRDAKIIHQSNNVVCVYFLSSNQHLCSTSLAENWNILHPPSIFSSVANILQLQRVCVLTPAHPQLSRMSVLFGDCSHQMHTTSEHVEGMQCKQIVRPII